MANTEENNVPPRYLLGDDLYSRLRLNYQHYLMIKSRGYIIHPSIPQSDPNIAVADVGTGTGIWLIDLAEKLPPTATLWGSDIRTDQFYPKEWLPENIKFQYLDILEGHAAEYEGKFDVIHVRYFMLVVQDDEQVLAVLRNMVKMLKPGGYVQWTEADKLTDAAILKTHPSNSTAALEKTKEILYSIDKRTKPVDWMARLGDIFEREGLKNIQEDALSFEKHGAQWRVLFQENIIAGMMELQERMPPGEKKDSFGEALRGALVESRAGAAWTYTLHTWIGQKP